MSKFMFFFQLFLVGKFFRHELLSLFLSPSGTKLQIQAWQMSSSATQQLLVNICSSAGTEIDSLCVNHHVLTTDEAFLLIHACGPVVAAEIISRVDAGGVQYAGDLVKYVKLQFLDCTNIGKVHGKLTPRSLDAFLASPFFGDRQKPVSFHVFLKSHLWLYILPFCLLKGMRPLLYVVRLTPRPLHAMRLRHSPTASAPPLTGALLLQIYRP